MLSNYPASRQYQIGQVGEANIWLNTRIRGNPSPYARVCGLRHTKQSFFAAMPMVSYWHFAAFAALQKSGRYRTNNGHWSTLVQNGYAAIDPSATLSVRRSRRANAAGRSYAAPASAGETAATMAYGPIQCISGTFLGTGGVADFGCSTIMEATGAYLAGRLKAAFPSGVPSQVWANPIQQVPNPAAWPPASSFPPPENSFQLPTGSPPRRK